jgi:hypothetical protein
LTVYLRTLAFIETITAGTSDRSLKRAAFEWEIEGLPVVRRKLFRPDPFKAVFET